MNKRHIFSLIILLSPLYVQSMERAGHKRPSPWQQKNKAELTHLLMDALDDGTATLEDIAGTINLGANIDEQDERGNSRLHIAADMGDSNMIERVARFAKTDLENNNHETPLMVAVGSSNHGNNHEHIVRLLAERVNAPQRTAALRFALSRKKRNEFIWLLEAGANLTEAELTAQNDAINQLIGNDEHAQQLMRTPFQKVTAAARTWGYNAWQQVREGLSSIAKEVDKEFVDN